MYIVVDVGGTKTRIAASRDLKTLGDTLIVDTMKTYADALAFITQTARKMAGDEPIEGLAAGIPALLTEDKRQISGAATNITDWKNRAIADDLERTLSTPVHLDNDVVLVGLGEAVFGAGRGSSVLVYLTVSTGVNGARIVDGKIEAHAPRPSLGYQYLTMDKELTRWEDMLSGRSIQKQYGVPPKELGKDSPVWEGLARIVAFGLHNTILHWSPDRIVLGGSMFNEIGIPVDRVRLHLKEIMQAIPELPDILHGELGEVGGLWGGVALLDQIKHSGAVS